MTRAEFTAHAERHRAELQVHCYRMLGSVQDAEDLLQETLVAAWRALPDFERRASLRTWLYRIATNRCLNVMRDRERRPRVLSSEPWPDPQPPPPSARPEPLWLEPYPDVLLEGVPDTAPGPEARYELREGVALALTAGLQRLPSRQRAALVLRDVLGYRAREAADMLGTSTAALNGALQRARATIEAERPAGDRDGAPLPDSPAERQLIDRYIEAQERGDIGAIVAMLTEDAVLTMPPEPLAYIGPEAIAGFLARLDGTMQRFQMLATRANGHPAVAHYLSERDGEPSQPAVIDVLTLEGPRIVAITAFIGRETFARFGLPASLPA